MRKAIIFFSASYLAFIAYANFGHVPTFSASEPLVSKSFRLLNPTPQTIATLKEVNKESDEITAIGVDTKDSTIGVTYKFQKITSSDVLQKLQANGEVQLVELPRERTTDSADPEDSSSLWSKIVVAHRFHH